MHVKLDQNIYGGKTNLCQKMESTVTVSNRVTAPVAMPVKAVFTNSIWTKQVQEFVML